MATTTCFLEEIQSSNTELRSLLFNPAWYAEVHQSKDRTLLNIHKNLSRRGKKGKGVGDRSITSTGDTIVH